MGELLSFFLSAVLWGDPQFLQMQEVVVPQYFQVAAAPIRLDQFEPIITAPAVLMADVESGQEIWSDNAHDARPMASLTKLMTALLILENHALSEVVTVPREAVVVEGAKMKLLSGEEMTVGDLLRGLLIPSGNDAAITLATYHSGSEAEFVEAMNRRAYFLGMENTHFENSHGLDENGHVSTPADMLLLARAVLQYPVVRQIANTDRLTVTSTDGEIVHDLRTTNDLLSSPFPVFGLKTGTTDEAGQCLITLVRTGGKEILIIVLGSENRFADTKALLSPFL